MPDFEFLKISLANKVAEASLNRADKANALHEKMWYEVEAAFRWADETPEVRAGILRSEGTRFSSGIDFEFVMSIAQRMESLPDGRRQEKLLAIIRSLQASFTRIESCRKPVIAAKLKVDRSMKVVQVGHCDNRGSAAFNRRLANKRAKAVKAKQMSIAVPQLAQSGSTEEEHAQNRRVEIQ
jgi:hypothetical protein